MMLVNPESVLVGLEDGSLLQWDFEPNSTKKIDLGNKEKISVLTKCENLLFTGDSSGTLNIRSDPNFDPVFPPTQTVTKYKVDKILVLRNLKGEDWAVIGDSMGNITLSRIAAGQKQVTFAAFTDHPDKHHIVLMFVGGNDLYALSSAGILRRWNIS